MPIEDDTTFELVSDDVRQGLGPVFAPEGDQPFSVPEELRSEDVITNGTVSAVPWSYHCRQVDRFQGVFPTGREIDIHGVTLVDVRSEDRPTFRRYIDWAGVFSQLGLQVSGRVPVDEAEYAFGRGVIAANPSPDS